MRQTIVGPCFVETDTSMSHSIFIVALRWITVVLANVGKFGVSAAFAVIYVWSAELFPTMVRNSGMGSSSMMARVGGMICPYIADLVSSFDSVLCYLLSIFCNSITHSKI